MIIPVLVVVSCVVVVLVGLWVRWRWCHRRLLALAQAVPGPRALPLVGNAIMFMRNEPLSIINGLLKQYGEYVKYWIGPNVDIVVNNPEDIKMLLTSNKLFMKGPVYDFMLPALGTGIFTGGEGWRNHRKIVTPSYNKKSVHHFSRVFNMEAERLVEVLSSQDPQTSFDVYVHVVNATTQSVCQTLMGLSKKETSNLKHLSKIIFDTKRQYDTAYKRMTGVWLQIPIIYWLSGQKRKDDQFVKMTKEMSAEILSKRRKALERNEEVEEDAKGIVDRLILSGELSDEEIMFETFTLFTTSQEASAKIASAVLVFLAHLPEWQERVYNEIVECLGPNDEFVSDEQLSKLVYLDAVYKEVLRYMSIGPTIQRRVLEEITINDGKITLPVGASVVIPIHLLHQDPRYWDEPLKIKPERFLPENWNNRNSNAFIPYSIGPMDCLGRVFAVVMIKIMVVRVLRLLAVEAEGCVEDLDLHAAISMRFTEGYNVRIRPRRTNSRESSSQANNLIQSHKS